MDADSLVQEVTDRTPTREQDWTVSAVVADRVFNRLAGPGGANRDRVNLHPPRCPGRPGEEDGLADLWMDRPTPTKGTDCQVTVGGQVVY